MSSFKVVPHSGPVFEAMMLEIDAQLVAEGKQIENRPLLAAREVSLKHQISVPLFGDPGRLPPEWRPYAKLGEAIRQWYTDRYGDRLKIDMNAGRTVVRLEGDLYVLKVPRIFGAVRFQIARNFLPKPQTSRGPADCNVVQLIEHMTPARAAQLSDGSLEEIRVAFASALPASYTLETTSHELMRSARGDVTTAISCLMHRDGRCGESKWASLQAAEKVLKAAIALQGETFKFTHDLEQLCSDLNRAGVSVDAHDLLQAIQCTPAARYGQEPCTQDQALAAHAASLVLVNRVRQAGAKFELGLG